MDEELLNEVEERLNELKLIHGESEIDELQINEILRDEFNQEEYTEILIHLGINEKLDLEEEDPYEKEEVIGGGDKDYNTLIKTLLVTKQELFETEMKLRGYDKEGKKYIKKRIELLPSKDIVFIIEFLKDNLSPQALMSQLKSKTKEFDSSMNTFLTKFKSTFENYKDNIVSAEEQSDVIQLLLSKIITVRRVIQDGKLSSALRDMIIGSYNEVQEAERSKKDLLKDNLG